MSEYHIRALTPDDALAWRELRLKMLREDPEGFFADFDEATKLSDAEWRQRMLQAPDAMFGLFVDRQLCGSAGFVKEKTIKLAHKGLMVAVYVAPEMRGQGHAQALVQALIDHARKHVDVLQTGASHAGKPVYESLGFETYGIERDAYRVNGKPLDNILMAMHFREPSG